MTRRNLLIALGAGALAGPLEPFAQQPAKIARIGYLGLTSASDWASRGEALRAGLRELGYVEGKNIAIEFRWAEGNYDRLPELAAELVRLKVDVFLTYSAAAIRAAMRATTTIPIVMENSADAVGSGLVASLARPGGNVTGMTFFSPELSAKRIELLKETVSRVVKVAVLMNPDNLSNGLHLSAMELTAKSLKMELHRFEARRPDEFSGVFAAMVKKRINAVAVPDDVVFNANIRGIVELAAKNRLPLTGGAGFADAGGLIGYGVNFLDLSRRAAYFVDRILKGAKPADLPVERPTKFELVLNMKTAKALGIKIPNSILLRADRVIE